MNSSRSSEIDSYRMAVDMSFKVLSPLETSDIIVQTIDAKRETGHNIFYDTIKVNGKEIIQKAEKPTTPSAITNNARKRYHYKRSNAKRDWKKPPVIIPQYHVCLHTLQTC